MIDIVPIKISKLLQIINLKFLKNKFNSQSDINIGSYNLNLNSRKICKNNIKLDLTEREANLIVFLKQSPTPVKIDQLQKEVWEHGHKLAVVLLLHHELQLLAQRSQNRSVLLRLLERLADQPLCVRQHRVVFALLFLQHGQHLFGLR